MNRFRRTTRALALAAGAAVLLAGAAPAVLAQQGVSAKLVMNNGDTDNHMTITAEGEDLRMDMSSPRGDVSMVWMPDRMLMIMHPQKMYMEFSKEMMDRMKGMMHNMPNMPDTEAQEEPDVSKYTFERTGNTDTINGMSAFEVTMKGSGVDNDARLWMTEDTDIGMFEVFAQMGEAMANMNMPMFNRGAGANPTDALRSYMGMAHAQGLPDGRVIRVVNTNDGKTTTITLESVEKGPFAASRFEAPDGYTKQQMPTMQH